MRRPSSASAVEPRAITNNTANRARARYSAVAKHFRYHDSLLSHFLGLRPLARAGKIHDPRSAVQALVFIAIGGDELVGIPGVLDFRSFTAHFDLFSHQLVLLIVLYALVDERQGRGIALPSWKARTETSLSSSQVNSTSTGVRAGSSPSVSWRADRARPRSSYCSSNTHGRCQIKG